MVFNSFGLSFEHKILIINFLSLILFIRMKKYMFQIVCVATLTCLQTTINAQSYFPLDLGAKWSYTVTDFATSDTNRMNLKAMVNGEHKREKWSVNEITYQVRKDSVINGKSYKVITNSKDPFERTLVREEAGNYFQFNNKTFKDDNFLKTDVKVDDIWLDYENPEQTAATLYVVISIDNTKVIQGETYKNVIGIGQITASMEQIVEFVRSGSQFMPIKYYSKGLGLIYSYMPYPLSGTYSDLEKAIKQ